MSDAEPTYEEWAVVDRWWTDEPIRRSYRFHRGVTEMREGDDQTWHVVESAEHEPDDERTERDADGEQSRVGA